MRLVGIAMLGTAALLALAATLIWRDVSAGSYIAAIIGAIYVLAAFGAAAARQWWDAGFYGITGTALVALAAAERRQAAPPGSDAG